jgi:hypothetical protein
MKGEELVKAIILAKGCTRVHAVKLMLDGYVPPSRKPVDAKKDPKLARLLVIFDTLVGRGVGKDQACRTACIMVEGLPRE